MNIKKSEIPPVGPVIRRLRKSRGLTLQKLIEQSQDDDDPDAKSYDAGNLSRFERGGQRRIGDDFLFRMCKALGTTRAEVYEEADAKPGNELAPLLAACRKLPPEYVDLAYALVSALSSHGLAGIGRETLNLPVKRDIKSRQAAKKRRDSTGS